MRCDTDKGVKYQAGRTGQSGTVGQGRQGSGDTQSCRLEVWPASRVDANSRTRTSKDVATGVQY